MSPSDDVPVRSVTLTTSDGVRLRGDYRPARAPSGPLVGLCHGLTQRRTRQPIRRVLDALAGDVPLLTMDLRGHGRSAGRCTLGDEEVLDVAVAEGRRLGHERVVTLGFSMGAAVVLRHAALAGAGERPDAVVAVSSPSRWWIRETPAMRRVHWIVEQPHGRLAGRVLGVRIAGHWYDGGWAVVPSSPVEVVHRVAPTPLLLVHGDDDRYFGAEHAVALHRASGCHGELWIEPDMGHGATGTSPALVRRMVDWAHQAIEDTPVEETPVEELTVEVERDGEAA